MSQTQQKTHKSQEFPSIWRITDALDELDKRYGGNSLPRLIKRIRDGEFSSTQVAGILGAAAMRHNPPLPRVSVRRARFWMQKRAPLRDKR